MIDKWIAKQKRVAELERLYPEIAWRNAMLGLAHDALRRSLIEVLTSRGLILTSEQARYIGAGWNIVQLAASLQRAFSIESVDKLFDDDGATERLAEAYGLAMTR